MDALSCLVGCLVGYLVAEFYLAEEVECVCFCSGDGGDVERLECGCCVCTEQRSACISAADPGEGWK